TRLDEGLETDQPQLGELHAALPWRARCPRQRKELPNLEKGIDNRRHLLNRHRSRILLSVDEERRRGGYAQLRAFCTHGPYIIEKLLVRQARLKALLCKTGKFGNIKQ